VNANENENINENREKKHYENKCTVAMLHVSDCDSVHSMKVGKLQKGGSAMEKEKVKEKEGIS
jgi:hypothetical protein